MNDKQKEILVIAQEECAEVIQEISKCFRFGIENTHKSGALHKDVLAEELGDLLCMIDLILEYDLVDINKVESAKQNKKKKLEIYSSIFK